MTKDGVLTSETVASCVSYLGRGCPGLQSMYQQLSLPSQNLSNISVLCTYVHLQKLELPHNNIKDLSCVSHMPYLVILDASHNEITDFFGFEPPKNLKEVNLSHNRMTKMKDLSAYLYLSKLDLGYNSLSEISGLEKCCSLTNLNLEHNRISKICGLSTLPLTHLCLRGNQLEEIEGLENQRSLQVLDLSSNRIVSLSGLQDLHLLCSLNLEKNLISEIQECKHIHDLCLLRDLKLMGNPVQEQADYRLAVIFVLQQLSVLDQDKVTAEEKVTAVNKYDPPMEVVAARDHITQLVYQLMQPQVVYDSTLPSTDSPYPMLVLSGPQGCGKRELTHRLCQEFSEFFAYGTSHTTRGPYYGEENGIDYHFVTEEEFQNLVHMGKFIQTMQYGGHRYGLTRDAIEDVARDGLACCVHMELEGVLVLKKSYFEPRYVLLLPTQVEKYTGLLQSRGLYTPAQIDAAVSRVELYADANKQRPGFFDSVIPCNDLEEAYQTLRRVVNEYLMLEEKDGEENDRVPADNASKGDPSEEKPPSPPSRSPSGPVLSPSAPPLDPSRLSYRNYLTKIRAELSPEKSPAELASITRREQLVREAIAGKSPGIYSQLFTRSAPAAPPPKLDPAPRDDEDSGASLKALLPKQDPVPPVNEDVSSVVSRASSALSLPSSAGVLSGSVEPLDVTVLGHALESLKEQSPHPDADQLSVATSPPADGRPGSSAKAVLPPIPTGRRTPALPSPAPSPRLSPNSAVAEGGGPETEG